MELVWRLVGVAVWLGVDWFAYRQYARGSLSRRACAWIAGIGLFAGLALAGLWMVAPASYLLWLAIIAVGSVPGAWVAYEVAPLVASSMRRDQ